MNKKEFKVVGASAVGTAFEWYDFFLYGALVPIIGAKFFGEYNQTTQTVFALLTFAIGFVVRPLGALMFARMGDLVGRKTVFLITLVMIGVSTITVGLLPDSSQIGVAAPILLIVCRIVQGLAVSGEFGSALTYVSEYAPNRSRGFFVGWLVGTTALALSVSLGVQLAVESIVGTEAFNDWGWRIPFIISVFPLLLSVWIRVKLQESPVFLAMKEAGTQSKAPIKEAFGQWKNVRLVLVVFVMAATQSIMGYMSTFYMLTLMKTNMKVDSFTVNVIFMVVMLTGFFLCVFFCWLSDRIGRKRILFTSLVLSAITLFPVFNGILSAANPPLAEAQQSVTTVIQTDVSQCAFQFNPTGTAEFTSFCDTSRMVLNANSVRFDTVASDVDQVVVNDTVIAAGPGFEDRLVEAVRTAGYPGLNATGSVEITTFGDLFTPQVLTVIGLLLILVIYAQMAQGPAATAMIELFPTRIRYTAMSFPYQLGVGVFGGFLPAMMVAIAAEAGSTVTALWYPIICISIGMSILLFTLPETRGVDLAEIGADDDAALQESDPTVAKD